MTDMPLDLAPAVPPEAAAAHLPGWYRWVASVDHKQIGIMYLFVVLGFLLVGGVEAMLMRIQLAIPNNHFLSPEVYDQLFTLHGTTMIFLVVIPLGLGLAVYMVPLMIGGATWRCPG